MRHITFALFLIIIKSPNEVWRLIVFAPFLIKSLNEDWRLIVFAPFLLIIIIIKSPNEVRRLNVFAPFLIITSPRLLSGDVLLFYVSFSLLVFLLWLQNEVCETYYFCSVSYYYY